MAPTMAEPDRLESLVERLERIAAELRAGELSAERAAAAGGHGGAGQGDGGDGGGGGRATDQALGHAWRSFP